MTDQTLIAMTAASVGYDGVAVLRGITWSVSAGQAWFLIGRNGAGKSTLLATAIGRLAPLAGEVRRRPGLVIASVPQHCNLTHDLPVTVTEFVGSALVDLTRAERSACVTTALATCGLTQVADRQMWRISGGERRRAMIARAVGRRPDLLALDEPFAGLDADGERDLMALLNRLRGEGVTIICITHDWALAAAQASQVAMIAEGTLREIAPQRLSEWSAGVALGMR